MISRIKEESSNKSKIAKVETYCPESFKDVVEIMDVLIAGNSLVVNLINLKKTTSQRVLDMLCGALYVIGGSLSELDDEKYLFNIE